MQGGIEEKIIKGKGMEGSPPTQVISPILENTLKVNFHFDNPIWLTHIRKGLTEV